MRAGAQIRRGVNQVSLKDRDLSSRKAANQVESLASFAGGGDRRQEGLPGLPQSQVPRQGQKVKYESFNSENCVKSKS